MISVQLILMLYFLGGNAWGTEKTATMPVFDTAHFANTLSIGGSVLWISYVLSPCILSVTPASKRIAGSRSTSGGHSLYWFYSGVLCCGYYEVLSPLPSYCEYFLQYKLISKVLQAHSLRMKHTASTCAISKHTLLVRYSSSKSMCARDYTVATAAAARVRVLHASQKAS